MAKLNEFGFDPKVWDDMNSRIKSWIELNKQLWKNMTAYEKEMAQKWVESGKKIKEATQGYADIQDITKKIHDNLKGTHKTNKLNASIMGTTQDISAKYFKESEKGNKADKKKLKSWKGIVDLSDDFRVNVSAIGTDEFRNLDINKQIREAKKAGNLGEIEYLKSLKLEHDIQKKLNNEINTKADLIKKPFTTLDDMIKGIPVVGDLLSAKLDLVGKGENMAEQFTNSARDAIDGAKSEVLGWNKFQQTKGGQGFTKKEISSQYAEHKKGAKGGQKGFQMMGAAAAAIGVAIIGWGVSTLNFARELGVSFTELNASAIFFKDQTQAVLDEFGSLRDVSNGLLFNMKWQSFWTGAQATDMAKVMMLQQSITGDTKEMALDKQAKFMKSIKKEGLSAAKVMGDLASNADMFAEFAKDGGKNMEDAAKQAAKMGLDLSATSAVAEKLLDYEGSIAAEMEASVLLGRSINLDKARQLAYDGKLTQMMEEVKKQAGGEAAFAKMSVDQRRSLGDMIGLQGANLSEFIKTQDEEHKAAGKNFGVWGAILGGLFGLLVAMKTVMKGIVNPFAGMFGGAKDLAMGAAMVAGGAVLGGGIQALAGRARGGPVSAGKPYIVGEKRPELFIPQTGGNILPHVPRMERGDAFIKDDMSRTNSKLDRMIGLMSARNEQADIQTRKLAGKFADSRIQG